MTWRRVYVAIYARQLGSMPIIRGDRVSYVWSTRYYLLIVIVEAHGRRGTLLIKMSDCAVLMKNGFDEE